MPKAYSQAHVVAAAVIEHAGKFLLVRENKPGHPDHGKWNTPAGWVDLGEDLLTAVVREVREETAGDFTPEALLGIYAIVRRDIAKADGYPHGIKVVFTGTFSASDAALHDDVSETRWFAPEEIMAMDPTTLRDADIPDMIRDYRAGTRFPLSILHHTIIAPG